MSTTINPNALADDLLLWLGQNVESFEKGVEPIHILNALNLTADQYRYVINFLEATGLVAGANIFNGSRTVLSNPRLTPEGWKKFYDLTTYTSNSMLAFMAMQFHGAQFTMGMYNQFAQSIERETAFKLRILPEADQPMGLIDDHLRVEIKRSRFLIAEVTELNHNVIWEAGYADGLGKKVVYLCEEAVYKKRKSKKKDVFDIEHQLTIPWNASNIQDAINKLVDCIRNTFDDAKLFSTGD